jgi:aminoglycoside phosphotransferase family enzyme
LEADKVRFLSAPQAYPNKPPKVLVEETHMSWVFLAGDRVYKLKKPVITSYLDFSTVERRERNCREEIRLNRRLAPDVYLGEVPLVVSSGGNLSLDGPGLVVDWLVFMRRLPADRMLDYAIVHKQLSKGTVLTVADYLTSFYISSPPVEITAEEYLTQFAQEHRHNRSVLFDTGLLDSGLVNQALTQIENALEKPATGLAQRVAAHRIIDGHGDLRPEHICLEARPVVIDCLEFNQRLRMVDPLDELIFLSLECARLGAAWIGPMALQRYCERSADNPRSELVEFYWAYRACLRARLSLVHILEGDKRKPEKWLPLAQHYLALACSPLSHILPRGQ